MLVILTVKLVTKEDTTPLENVLLVTSIVIVKLVNNVLLTPEDVSMTKPFVTLKVTLSYLVENIVNLVNIHYS
jgi:hypothetical protein